ncbi:MAG: hypothetical protein ACYC27_04860 [Armatimonadota bacterium]
MGAFYNTIFVRDISQDEMEAAAESIAKSARCSLYVAPAIRGWTAVYPCSDCEHDELISSLLAEKIKNHIIHTMVHDSDIFMYVYFYNGELLDEFSSDPDYFETATDEERIALQGNPSVFAALVSEQLPALAEALEGARDGECAFADDALADFAEILNLPNALTSYEYLADGETDDIEGWDSFIKISP